ncbi:MAG: T9SS type A sorting domain-containing protein [FCB group bacterium]|nr:T9SS type A sorting domain-containing protein [FCB group bacterium]MBL7028712.1 T9SS type A sorting domain-containing protein [Candidatus Neomarinimicrobiota bacterium]MBL7120684.1 T9SS type A sorting domain-containing protein [Candidatus Neomarinimicrobiota bacterium]
MPKYNFSILAIYVTLFVLAARVAGAEPLLQNHLTSPESYRMGRYYQPETQAGILNLDGTLRSAYSPVQHKKNIDLINQIEDLRVASIHPQGGLIQIFPQNNAPALLKTATDQYLLMEETQTYYFDEIPSIERKVFSYDEHANNIRMELTVEENSAWRNQWMETSSYDASNSLDTLTGHRWVNSNWEQAQQRTMSYNIEMDLLEEYGYYWENGDWETSTRTLYTYDTEHRELIELSQYLENGNWVDSYEVLSSYDSTGNLTQEMWRFNNGAGLENASLNEYSYNDNNALIEDLFKYSENGAWLNGERYAYGYDVAGNRTELLIAIWEDGSWENSYRSFLSYNVNNNQTGALGSVWTGSRWTQTVQISFTYDENQNNTAYLMRQNWDGSGWQTFMEYTRIYAILGTTGVDQKVDQTPATFELQGNYPNPFNPSTTIDFSLNRQAQVELQIVDLKGKTLATLISGSQSAGQYSIQFNAENYASGVYLYRLAVDNSVQTRKLTLLK